MPDEKKLKGMVFEAAIKLEPTYQAYNQDIGMVNFYFERASVLQFKRALRMTMIDYISQIGGLLGLGIGFSLISGVEMIYWITLRLVGNYRKEMERFSRASSVKSCKSKITDVTIVDQV